MRRARLVVPVLAGVVGLGGGVLTALASQEAPEPPPPESFNDPLHLGIPLVDLECTGEPLLVLASGDAGAPLAAAVANGGDLPLRYLRTDDSCETRFVAGSAPSPAYVVYAGPYDAMAEPCAVQLGVGDALPAGIGVTNLEAGARSFVTCACVLPAADFPELEPGQLPDPDLAIWVRTLQRLLVTLDADEQEDRRPFEPAEVSGVYDERTEQRVRAFQAGADISPLEYGAVREATWRALASTACADADF